MSVVNSVLDKLSKVKATGSGRWVACCPAHNDKSPSLSIRETDDGRVLIHCFGGCDVESVMGAIGLELNDLFPDAPLQGSKKQRPYSNDVLTCLLHEARIVELCANDMLNGAQLSNDDVARLALAVNRIESAVYYAKL